MNSQTSPASLWETSVLRGIPLVSDPLKEPQQAVAVLDQLPVQPLQEVQQVAVAPLRAHCEHPPLAVADNPEFH